MWRKRTHSFTQSECWRMSCWVFESDWGRRAGNLFNVPKRNHIKRYARRVEFLFVVWFSLFLPSVLVSSSDLHVSIRVCHLRKGRRRLPSLSWPRLFLSKESHPFRRSTTLLSLYYVGKRICETLVYFLVFFTVEVGNLTTKTISETCKFHKLITRSIRGYYDDKTKFYKRLFLTQFICIMKGYISLPGESRLNLKLSLNIFFARGGRVWPMTIRV
jgi:hypothetical protein